MTLLSYVHGASDKPLLGKTIGQAFDQATQQYADELALVSRQQGIRYTYRELRDQVDRGICQGSCHSYINFKLLLLLLNHSPDLA